MKYIVTVAGILLAGTAWAQAVQPRMAEAVQPRSATIESRPAPAVQPRSADAVAPRESAPVAGTAVSGPAEGWQWQQLGPTGVAADGVALGMRLANIRCAGVRCEVFADSAGAWVIRAEGGFPRLAGNTFQIVLLNHGTDRAQVPERARGVFSDGRFWDLIDTWQLPAGRYGAYYADPRAGQVVAAVQFEVQRIAKSQVTTPARKGGQGGGNAEAARLRAAEEARKLQRCLAMAATNPNVTCVQR